MKKKCKKKIPKLEDGTENPNALTPQPEKSNCPCPLDENGNCPCDPNKKIIDGATSNSANVLGFAGNALFGASMTGQPDPAMGAIGGALSGLTTGGPIAALWGALSGFAASGQAREDYEKMIASQQDRYMKDRTFMPGQYEDGGVPEFDRIQTEDGEMLVLPNLEISKVKAKEKHKDMDDYEVTDAIQPGTIVFSNKKKIDLKRHADTELSEAISFYDENDNYHFEGLKVGDILGDKGEITFAEAMQRVKKYYPTSTAKNLMSEKTNAENLAARKPIIEYLLKLQSGVPTEQEQEEEEVPKAEMGWPGIKKTLSQLGFIDEPPEEELLPGQTSIGNIPQNYTSGDPSLRGAAPQQAPAKRFNPYEQLLDPNQVAAPTTEQTTVTQTPAASSYNPYAQLIDPAQAGQLTTDNTLPTDPQISLRQPANAMQGTPVPATSAPAAATQPAAPTENQSGMSQDDLNLDNLLEKFRAKYGAQRKELDQRYKTDQDEISTLVRRKNQNNALQLGSQVLFSGLQSGYANPALESTSLIEDQYRGVPAAVIEQQASATAANTNSVIHALAAAGVNPGEISNYAAKSMESVLDAQGNIRAKANEMNTVNNRQMIADYRSVIQGNNQRMADAENKLQDFNNKKLASIGDYLNTYLDNKDSIYDTEYRLTNANEADYYDAAGALDKGEAQIDAAKLLLRNGQDANQIPAPATGGVKNTNPQGVGFVPFNQLMDPNQVSGLTGDNTLPADPQINLSNKGGSAVDKMNNQKQALAKYINSLSPEEKAAFLKLIAG